MNDYRTPIARQPLPTMVRNLMLVKGVQLPESGKSILTINQTFTIKEKVTLPMALELTVKFVRPKAKEKDVLKPIDIECTFGCGKMELMHFRNLGVVDDSTVIKIPLTVDSIHIPIRSKPEVSVKINSSLPIHVLVESITASTIATRNVMSGATDYIVDLGD